jgi:signal transduction histidine kinase/ligand-binding sensor domain-containing protein
MSSPSRSAYRYLLAALLAFTCDTGRPLDRDRSIDQLPHSAWYAKDGAPADVWAIAQTSDGWLWFGGSAGLYRFDGISFERIKIHANEPSRSEAISALFALESGELLIGYLYGGASILQNGRFIDYRAEDGPGSATVFSFGQDSDGVLWAATRSGLLRLDGQRWRRVGSDWNFPGGYASNVFLDQHGTLWAAAPREVLRLKHGTHSFQGLGLTVASMAEFIQSPDGRTWYSDTSGVRPLPGQTDVGPRRPFTNSRASYSTLFDRDGNLWSLRERLDRFTPDQGLPLPSKFEVPTAGASGASEALGAEGLKTILEDREGNVWITTGRGIHRFRNANVVKLLAGTSGPPLVAGLAAGDNGVVWMAVYTSASASYKSDGVWRFDGRLQHVQPREITSASAVHRAMDGSVWIGGRQGLWRYDGKRFVKALELPDAARGRPVQSIAADASGDLWVSVDGVGLFRHRGTIWQRNGNISQLPPEGPYVQARDPAGRLWLGYGDNSVFVLDQEHVTAFTAADGVQLGAVTAISTGRYTLLAGEHGLSVLRDGRFQALKATDPSAFDGVKGLVELSNGDVWLNGSRGAVRISASEMQTALGQRTPELAVETFDSNEGYPGSGTTAGYYPQPMMVLATDGRVWLRGADGVAWIDPRRIHRNLVPPVVLTRSLSANGQRSDPADGMRLARGTRNVQLDYTALSYSQPERLHFRYRLEGVDPGWVDAGARRQAFYTNLGPGTYRFEVMAANENDVWSSSPAALEFVIPPTFVQTRTFLALCIAAAVGLLWLLYQIRVRQLTARERDRLEERLGERERIARELHDTLLQSTQGLILRFQAAADRLPEGDSTRRMLEQTLERADEVLVEGRERVLDLRLPTDAMSDLPQALADAGNDLAQGRAAAFRTVVEGTVHDLVRTVKSEAYRIGREALFNAFAHAEADSIEVQVIYTEEDFRLRVRDDGRGIDASALEARSRPGHWGLTGMRERAQKIGGQLDIWSRYGAGTEIELKIPASVAYAERSSRSRWRPLRRLAGGER